MADYFWAEIEIGGPIRRSLVTRLRELMKEPAANYSADEVLTANLKQLFSDFDPATGYLHLEDPDARYGQFEELEEFLRGEDVGYNRRSDGKYEFTPEEARFRAGMAQPAIRYMTHEFAPVVSQREAEQARQLLEAGHASDALVKLRELVGPTLADLPPLQIID